jgi:hypothetical protein
VNPVSVEAFSQFLAKGLGRAHVILAAESSDSYGDALVEACLTDVAYDAQVEAPRAPYLHELVKLAELSERVAGSLVRSLDDGEADDHSIAQRWELAGLLARDGLPGVREKMYAGLRRLIDHWDRASRNSLPPTEPARQLILLDGVPGALFAFGQLGRLAVADADYWNDSGLLDEARSVAGAAKLDAILAEARPSDSQLDAYLRAVEAYEAANTERRAGKAERRREQHVSLGRPTWAQPWNEAQQAIEHQVRGTGQSGINWSQWGIRASARELRAAARSLIELPREDVELLRPYLSVFGRRTFPLDPQPIINLIDDPREKVAWFAANALARITHPAVRTLALRMAVEGPLQQRSVDVLAANWQDGDEQVVERLLRNNADADSLHALGTGLRALAEQHLSADLVPALLLGYERTPCSECRGRFVEALVRLDALPDQHRAECRWDARQETRELVVVSRPQAPRRRSSQGTTRVTARQRHPS